ncbi:hypothetical protein LTR53_020228, partial [Teratosphaeriaceae sp. CCFEE 6253]
PDALRAGALAPQRHGAGVAAERGDVLFHPDHGGALIEQAGVAGAFSEDGGVLEEAPDAEAVVDGDGNDRLAGVRGGLDNAGQIVLLVCG